MKIWAVFVCFLLLLLAGCVYERDCTQIRSGVERVSCMSQNALKKAIIEKDNEGAVAECEDIALNWGQSWEEEYGISAQDALWGAATCISLLAEAVEDEEICNYLDEDMFSGAQAHEIAVEKCIAYASPKGG